MARALVTGGSGFVGANLVRRLLRDGHEVHLLQRASYRPWRVTDLLNAVQVHIGDLHSAEAMQKLVGSLRPDWVFHLAAYGAYSYQQGMQAMIDTNLRGAVSLIDACVAYEVAAVVCAGSSSEYGWKDHAPHEQDWADPNSHYAITKLAATHYARLAALKHDLHIVTLRLYNIYGPYEEPTRLIPRLICFARHGRLPALVSPDIARDYTYVDDAVEAFMLAAQQQALPRGAVFNVGTGIQTSIAQLVDIIGHLLPLKEQPEWGSMPDRAWDTSVWIADPKAIEAALNWRAQTNVSGGLERTLHWLESQPGMLQFYETHGDALGSTSGASR